MIKVTLEFKGVDEAIVALGKLVGAPVATAASSPAGAEKPAAPTTRKPRADAGKKRGSYKNVEAPAASNGVAPATADPDSGKEGVQPSTPKLTTADPLAASTPETAAPPAPAEGDKPQPSGVMPAAAAAPSRLDAAKPPSEADAQAALEAVFTGKGLPAAQTLLAKFEVTRLRDLPAEKRAAFIEAAKEAAK